jgi:hypothetical protein
MQWVVRSMRCHPFRDLKDKKTKIVVEGVLE